MGKEVTQDMINEWKVEHGSVFRVTIADIDVYYTTLTRDNYVEIMGKQNTVPNFDPEVETVALCILNELDEGALGKKGGIATVVHEEIMKKSGFVVVESEEL